MLNTCPVRALNAEVYEIFQWFELTHDLVTSGDGASWWHLVRLPEEGALGGQDARLMAALGYLRHVENELLIEDLKKGDPGDELEAFRAEAR